MIFSINNPQPQSHSHLNLPLTVAILLLAFCSITDSSQNLAQFGSLTAIEESVFLQCLPNCLSCTTPYVCNTCQNGANCCPRFCSNCTNQIVCVNCQIGYTFNSSTETCQLVSACSWDTNCRTCATAFSSANLSSYCWECRSGYFYEQILNLCENCSLSFCKTCRSTSGSMQCTKCDSGYYLSASSTGSCLRCIDNCKLCKNTQGCTTCKLGFYFVDSSKSECRLCETGCQNCTDSNGCTQCKDGYQTSPVNGSCLVCSSQGCLNCSTNSKICKKCASDYVIQTAETCRACSSFVEGCDQCLVAGGIFTGNNSVECISCQFGQYLSQPGDWDYVEAEPCIYKIWTSSSAVIVLGIVVYGLCWVVCLLWDRFFTCWKKAVDHRDRWEEV